MGSCDQLTSLGSGIISPNIHLTQWWPHEAPESIALLPYHIMTQSVLLMKFTNCLITLVLIGFSLDFILEIICLSGASSLCSCETSRIFRIVCIHPSRLGGWGQKWTLTRNVLLDLPIIDSSILFTKVWMGYKSPSMNLDHTHENPLTSRVQLFLILCRLLENYFLVLNLFTILSLSFFLSTGFPFCP